MTEIHPMRRGAANWILNHTATVVRRRGGTEGRRPHPRTSRFGFFSNFSFLARVAVSEPLRLAVWDGERLVCNFVWDDHNPHTQQRVQISKGSAAIDLQFVCCGDEGTTFFLRHFQPISENGIINRRVAE